MIIGITGPTGSGKTTLLELLKEKGALVLDCDAIYHHLLVSDTALLGAIESRFPGTVVDGVLQRKKLGSLVFSDPRALEDLNTITHGAVKAQVETRLEAKPALAAIDAIALVESGLAQLCDVTVAVWAPRQQRILRLMERDGITEAYAVSRIDAQKDEQWFRENTDFVLENSGTYAEFQEKCLAFLSGLDIMEEK